MEQDTHHTLRIIIHASGNAMTMKQEGRITRAMAFKPGRLWEEPESSRTTGSLSLAFCKETFVVLRKCFYFGMRP